MTEVQPSRQQNDRLFLPAYQSAGCHAFAASVQGKSGAGSHRESMRKRPNSRTLFLAEKQTAWVFHHLGYDRGEPKQPEGFSHVDSPFYASPPLRVDKDLFFG
jgi:hypothetical protein